MIEDTEFLSKGRSIGLGGVSDKKLDAISFDTKKAKADRRKSTFVVASPGLNLGLNDVRPQAGRKKQDDSLLRGPAARRVKILAGVAQATDQSGALRSHRGTVRNDDISSNTIIRDFDKSDFQSREGLSFMGQSVTPDIQAKNGQNEYEGQTISPFAIPDHFIRGSPRERAGTLLSEKKKSLGPEAFMDIEVKQMDDASVTLSKRATSN